MKKIGFLITLLHSFIALAQQEITADITIDQYFNIQVNQYFGNKTNDTYLFPKNVSLNPLQATYINDKSSLKECQIQNVNAIQFEVITNKEQVFKDFFIIDSKYVGIKSNSFFDLKKFNLNITSNSFRLIFPTQEDLQEKYTTAPKIVAGEFNSFESNGFTIFYLESEKEYLEEMKKAAIGMSRSFDYYASFFGVKRKPKIVFAPTNQPSETTENIIVYNSDVVKGKNKENTVAHEIAHIWFGQDGLIIKERPVVEGITEFLSMQYNITQNGEKQLDRSISERFFMLEGKSSLNEVNKKNLTFSENNLLSYNLIPMYLHTRMNNNPNLINEIVAVYQKKIDKRKTTLDEINDLFQSNGVQTINANEAFPDVYIEELPNNEVAISTTSDEPLEVEISIQTVDNLKTKKILTFSKDQNKQTITTENTNKIIIDPNYKLMQVSRLNDVWNAKDNNLFNRNRYFAITSNTQMAAFAKALTDYLIGTSTSITTYNLTTQLQKKLEQLKKQYANHKLSGGSVSFSAKSNILYTSLAFIEEGKRETTVIRINCQFDTNLTTINSIKFN